MKADILRQGYVAGPDFDVTDTVGEWVNQQHPDSGEIIRKWQPNTLDNPATPDINEAAILESFRCIARGIVSPGIRGAGTTEHFGTLYQDIDYVKMTFPASVNISKRDRITNIRDLRGNLIWKEEEQPDEPPTIFNVMGVIPIIDPFGKNIESYALLERAERQ
jgi:hypothetical protein